MLEKFRKFLQSFKNDCKKAGEQIEQSLNEITDEKPCKTSFFSKITSKFKKNNTINEE